MKMENDNIMALAAARPRNYIKIKEDLIQQLEAYPSFSAEAIYSKPIGKRDGVMQYARGPSIRMAEACAEAYGYNRVRCDVILLPEGKVQLVASFVDYQRGRIWQASGIVSPYYRSSGGQMVKMPEDRFYDLKVKAESSKLIREVILRSIPPGLRADLVDAAEKKLSTLLDDKAIDKIVGQFATKGISLDHLEKHLGRTRKAGWTQEDRKNLLGLWNGVDTGETSVESIKSDEGDTPAPKAGNGGAAEALSGATTETEANDPTLDLIASLDSITSKAEFEDWPFANREALKKLGPAHSEKILAAMKSFGLRKGFAQVKK